MATVKHAISEHDVVVLRKPIGAWPKDTTGAVISVSGDMLLVEITGPGGKTLDAIPVPAAQLAVKRGSHDSVRREPAPDIKLIQDNVRARLAEVHRLVEPLRIETEQLLKISAAFEGPGATKVGPSKRTAQQVTGRAPRAIPTTSGAKPARLPGSASRTAQALATIGERPGITVTELAASMGIKANYLYRVLPRLEKQAKVIKRGKGYHPAPHATTKQA